MNKTCDFKKKTLLSMYQPKRSFCSSEGFTEQCSSALPFKKCAHKNLFPEFPRLTCFSESYCIRTFSAFFSVTCTGSTCPVDVSIGFKFQPLKRNISQSWSKAQNEKHKLDFSVSMSSTMCFYAKKKKKLRTLRQIPTLSTTSWSE